MIYAKVGPTTSSNLSPFDFSKFKSEEKFETGMPNKWNFDPINFGKEDANDLFSRDK